MKILMQTMMAITLLISGLQGQIPNVQFKDVRGKQYDLYQLLNKGKYLVVHTQYND